MHDDQHGTAVVTVAGMFNAVRVTGREFSDLSIVINGAGAAGIAIIHLLREIGVRQIVMCDSRGIIHRDRGDLTDIKKEVAEITNKKNLKGGLEDAIRNTDVFIGVSVPGVLSADMVRSMNPDPVIFAMANPTPEIMPAEATQAGARIIATGRSDFPNQINNVLAFPGIFRGLLDARYTKLTNKMYIAAARAIAEAVENPNEDKIIPGPFEPGVAMAVAEAVRSCSED